MSYFSDSTEWKYLFRNFMDWENIVPLYYPKFPTEDGIHGLEELMDLMEELISSISEWSRDSLATRAQALDQEGAGKIVEGCTVPGENLQKLYDEANSMELPSVTVPAEYGGMGLPYSVAMLALTQISRACQSSSTQIGFVHVVSDMIERYCDDNFRKKVIPKIKNGEISGAMCLTEPEAGSDVGNIKTTAVKQKDGSYLLNGTKCFISNGGAGICLILARIKGAPEGLKGLSLFYTEEWIENPKGEKTHNYQITKIEDKMGLHGSFTCEVVYENSVAHLVGEDGQGMSQMFYLMNEARVSVGLQALGGMEAVLDLARKYAETRVQFGKPIIEHPLLKNNLEEFEVERDAFRAFMVDVVSYFDVYQKLHLKKRHEGKLSPYEESLFREASQVIRKRTPLVKFYGAETYTRLSIKAIQIHGGYGFMKDYEVERLHRDSFATLLYEGTSQIQALMAVKDLVKTIMSRPLSFFFSEQKVKGGALKNRFARLNFKFNTKLSKLLFKCLRPKEAKKFFEAKYWKKQKGIEKLMTYAESICEAMAYLEILQVLSLHAQVDSSRSSLFEKYLKLVKPRLEGIYCKWES